MKSTYKQMIKYSNYEISKCGKVRNIKTQRVLKLQINTYGYAALQLYHDGKRTMTSLHRELARNYHKDFHEDLYVDHIDQNKLNNSLENLRMVSNSVNVRNANYRKNNKLKVKGVSVLKDKYLAQICIKGTKIGLGTFKTLKEAKNAYLIGEKIINTIEEKKLWN